MAIIEMFEKIRRKPGICLDGDKSLMRLRSFTVGYEGGAASTIKILTDREQESRRSRASIPLRVFA